MRHPAKVLTLSVAALALLTSCAGAPPAPGGHTAGKDEVQAAYEPRSAPGAGQQFLGRMVGEWTVEKTFHPRSGGAPAVTLGTCTQSLVHGGRFLQSDFRFGDGEAATTGTGVIGFDPSSGRFTSFWYDSRSTRVSVRQSNADFDGARIELVAHSLGNEANARQSRTVTEISVDGHQILHQQFGVGSDGKDRLVMQLRMTRP